MSQLLCYYNTLFVLNVILSIPHEKFISTNLIQDNKGCTTITHLNNETMNIFVNYKNDLTLNTSYIMFNEIYPLYKDVKILEKYEYFIETIILITLLYIIGLLFVIVGFLNIGMTLSLCAILVLFFNIITSQINYTKIHHPNFDCYNYTVNYSFVNW